MSDTPPPPADTPAETPKNQITRTEAEKVAILYLKHTKYPEEDREKLTQYIMTCDKGHVETQIKRLLSEKESDKKSV